MIDKITQDFIKSVIFVVCYSAFCAFFILGGSTFQYRRFIGKIYRKLNKFMSFPIIRMLPKVSYSLAVILGYLTYKNIYQIYLVTQFKSIKIWYYAYISLSIITAILFIYMALDNPKSIKSNNRELLCENDGKYYEGYDHFSHFFRMAIMKSNRRDFVMFNILTLALSIVFLGPSLRYLVIIFQFNQNKMVWSKNKVINSIAIISKIYNVDPRIGSQVVVFTTFMIYSISSLMDELILKLAGKTRYEVILKLTGAKNKKKERKDKKKHH